MEKQYIYALWYPTKTICGQTGGNVMKTSHAIQKKAKSNTPISSIAKKKNAVQAEKNSSNAPVKIIGKTVERPGFSSQTSSVIQPKPTEALDKITELWKSETQEKLRRTAPPEIANQIKRIEAENKGHGPIPRHRHGTARPKIVFSLLQRS